MKRLKQLFAASLMLVAIGFAVLPATPVLAADPSTTAACNAISDNKGCTSTGPSINSVIATVINVLSIVIGVVSVIMIMVAGFRFVTSGGDSNGVAAARNTIIYAIIGLVVTAFAQLIVKFVLHKVTVSPGH